MPFLTETFRKEMVSGFYKQNKYPPAKPGVFHMRAKPYVTSPRVSSRKYGLPAAKDLLLATRKRV